MGEMAQLVTFISEIDMGGIKMWGEIKIKASRHHCSALRNELVVQQICQTLIPS